MTLDYESFSALNDFSKCEKLYEIKRDPKKTSSGRFAATIIGSAIHNSIAALHDEPLFEIDSLVRDKVLESILEKEYEPVQWGEKPPYDRESRTNTAIRIVTNYWAMNRNIELRSSERWFFLDLKLGDNIIPIRGRFDQLIADGDKLVIRELKSGATAPDPEVLSRDLQIPLQAYALKYGVIALESVPYIARDDVKYHVHVWVPTEDKSIVTCSTCGMMAEKVGRFPDRVVYYDLAALDPGKTEWDKGNRTPKRQPEIPITFTPENWVNFTDRMAYWFQKISLAKTSGLFCPTGAHGAMSPCDGCHYSQHCNSQVATIHMDVKKK